MSFLELNFYSVYVNGFLVDYIEWFTDWLFLYNFFYLFLIYLPQIS
jgi:hypothetical protein